MNSIIISIVLYLLTFACAVAAPLNLESSNHISSDVDQPVQDSNDRNNANLYESRQPFFFHGQNYGSESQFGPINVFINVGMMLAGRFNYSDNIYDINYGGQFKNVAHSILRPDKSVEEMGYWGFLQREVLPFGTTGAWIPNYSLHFLGEGMVYRKMAEYYQAKNVLMPRTMAALTVTAAQLMNETIENGKTRHGNTDALADFWFNLGGIAAYSFDGFARLFTGRVKLLYWPGQPVIAAPDASLINHTEGYSWKIGMGDWTKWQLFIGTGLPSAFGFSVPQDAVNSYTYTVGFSAGDAAKGGGIWEKNSSESNSEDDSQLTSIPLTTLYPVVGFYWDRNHSLMLRALVGYSSALHLNINLFPGVFKINGYPVGGYVLTTGMESIAVGITFTLPVVPGYRYTD